MARRNSRNSVPSPMSGPLPDGALGTWFIDSTKMRKTVETGQLVSDKKMIVSRVLWVIRLRMLSGSSSGVSDIVGRLVVLMPAKGRTLVNVPNGPTGGFRLTPSVLKNGRASTEPFNSYCAAMAE